MNNQFSENLKRIRKENNLSQEQLADELGVSRQAISKWESAAAYPEMDKIIALCEKFNINIDDLLHKDIKEVKGEEESKKNINKSVDDFLMFITNTINLFGNMNFKSKVKCLFEQVIIAGILFFVSLFVYFVLDYLFENLLGFLPFKILYFITNVLDSVIIVALLVVAIIIMTHIFKTRYLDYYEKIKKESKNIDLNEDKEKDKDIDDNNKILYKKNDDKIIIRDPNHSEYKFINALFKFIIIIIKFFLLCFGFFVACGLIGLFVAFVASFMLIKTGLFFIGLLVTILSSAVIAIVILLLILNFVFNRKSDKKKMIWSFIISLVVFGIGCGLIFVGSLSFDVIKNVDSSLKSVTKEYNMNNDLVIYSYDKIEYVPSDNSNVKVEYFISEYCDVDDNYNRTNNNMIMSWSYCENPIKLARELIKNLNEKKLVPLNENIEKMVIYTNQSNIDILKRNWSNYLKEREEKESLKNHYESRINDLEDKNNELQQQVFELQEQLDNY